MSNKLRNVGRGVGASAVVAIVLLPAPFWMYLSVVVAFVLTISFLAALVTL